MQVAGRKGRERLMLGPGRCRQQIAQIADTVAAQTAVKAKARHLRVDKPPDHGEQVVELHQQRLAQNHRHRLLRRGQRGLQPVRRVAAFMHGVAISSFANGLLDRPEVLSQDQCGLGAGPDRCPHLRRRHGPRHCPRTNGGQWPDCDDGSTCAHPASNLPKNRSCHEKSRSPGGWVLIRDGTARASYI